MFGAQITIPDGAAVIAVRPRGAGGLRITYPRVGALAAGLLALLAGVALWLARMPDGAWEEPLEYAVGLLFAAPGLWGIGRAMRPRPVVILTDAELVVWYGPPFLERSLARLPLDTLDVRTTGRDERLVRVDGRLLSRWLLAAFVPVRGSKPSKSDVTRYTLEVRSRGQDEWLALFGSQVASEVENARIAMAAAAGAGAPIEVEEVNDSPSESFS